MNRAPAYDANKPTLVSVEDMINSAIIVDVHKNRVDYKLIQVILHILARQMRVLKSTVDLRIRDPVIKKQKEVISSSTSSSTSSTDSPRRRAKKEKQNRAEEEAKAAAADEQALAGIDEKRSKKTGPDENKKKLVTEFGDEDGKKASVGPECVSEATLASIKRIGSKVRDWKDKKARDKIEMDGERKGIEVSADQAGVEKDKWPLSSKESKKKGVGKKDKSRKPKVDVEESDKEKSEESESDTQFKKREGEEREGVKSGAEYEEGGERKKQKEKKITKGRVSEVAGERVTGEIHAEERVTEAIKESEKRAKKKSKGGGGVEGSEESTDEEQRAKYRDKKEKRGKEEKEKMRYEEQEKEKERVGKMSEAEREQYEKEKKKKAKMSPEQLEEYEKEKNIEKETLDKMGPKERDEYEREKAREREKKKKMSPKERKIYEEEAEKEKMDKMSSKEREKYEKDKEKEKEKLKKMSPKQRERYEEDEEKEKMDKMSSKERERYKKDKEKEKEKLKKMSPKERERYEEEEDKEKMDKMSSKERERYKKDKEKEKEKLKQMSPKERDEYEREKERLGKMSPKERDEYEREKERLGKMRPKERERYEKQAEKEKIDKMSSKERERYEKDKEKGKEKLKKMSPKERETYEKEKRREERSPSGSAISIIESDRKGEKVLVVEKGPTTYSSSGRMPRVGSVECVTRSEFELLERLVRSLKDKAGPLPMPSMPANDRLLDDIAKGNATLPDTMEAMQMAARLQAAEAAIQRMAGLLTQLAASGALPKDEIAQIEALTSELQDAETSGALDDDKSTKELSGGGATPVQQYTSKPVPKSVTLKSATDGGTSSLKSAMRWQTAVGRTSISSSADSPGTLHVTPMEMKDAIEDLKANMKAHMAGVLAKAQSNCESAAGAAKSIEDRMIMALKLNCRLNDITSVVTDYSEQLQGFDAGLSTQMAGFQEQMTLLRRDLGGGLQQLEKANNNAESEALNDLTGRYETLVDELDSTLHDHGKLNMHQNQLGDELRSLVAAVEILREEKADRDEVLDGLRDKADLSRLTGLLTDKAFAVARKQLEDRLHICYDKFEKQEVVWMDAIKDLSEITSQKAELMMLLAAKDDAQTQLRELQERLDYLALVLGEPMAAIVTRQVSKNATCGPCMVPALQGAVEPSYGKPHPMPQARPAPLGQDQEPCTQDVKLPLPPDDRHPCHRWVGGSHTLVTNSVRRVKAPSTVADLLGPPVKIHHGQGTDGRLYVMETELVPCDECHECRRERLPNEDPLQTRHVDVCLREENDKKTTDEGPPAGGAGDAGG